MAIRLPRVYLGYKIYGGCNYQCRVVNPPQLCHFKGFYPIMAGAGQANECKKKKRSEADAERECVRELERRGKLWALHKLHTGADVNFLHPWVNNWLLGRGCAVGMLRSGLIAG